MSPVIPGGGLTTLDAAGWTQVWKADDYEPDLTVAGTYAGGALHSFKGHLYWGTMHVPFLATVVATAYLDLDADGSSSVDSNELLTTALGTYRAINIFRGRNFATTPELEVLYGLQYLPVYDSITKSYTIALILCMKTRCRIPFPNGDSQVSGTSLMLTRGPWLNITINSLSELSTGAISLLRNS